MNMDMMDNFFKVIHIPTSTTTLTIYTKSMIDPISLEICLIKKPEQVVISSLNYLQAIQLFLLELLQQMKPLQFLLFDSNLLSQFVEKSYR